MSRPLEQVLAEARNLAAAGVRELTLLGQNVNAYHGLDAAGRTVGLGELCRRLADIEGLARIRYTTSHPLDMSDDLLSAHRDVPALMPYLHLPVQSGSDRILAAMNRRHTRADYLRVIERIMARAPRHGHVRRFSSSASPRDRCRFRGDPVAGREVGYASAFTFKYSIRPGTPGATMDDQVPRGGQDRAPAAPQ